MLKHSKMWSNDYQPTVWRIEVTCKGQHFTLYIKTCLLQNVSNRVFIRLKSKTIKFGQNKGVLITNCYFFKTLEKICEDGSSPRKQNFSGFGFSSSTRFRRSSSSTITTSSTKPWVSFLHVKFVPLINYFDYSSFLIFMSQ